MFIIRHVRFFLSPKLLSQNCCAHNRSKYAGDKYGFDILTDKLFCVFQTKTTGQDLFKTICDEQSIPQADREYFSLSYKNKGGRKVHKFVSDVNVC